MRPAPSLWTKLFMLSAVDVDLPAAQHVSTQYRVTVTNVSPTASTDTLREFFGFCGPVGAIDLAADADGVQRGSVSFHSAAAAETALLLDQALIVDRPITIASATQAAEGAALADAADSHPLLPPGGGGLPGAMPVKAPLDEPPEAPPPHEDEDDVEVVASVAGASAAVGDEGTPAESARKTIANLLAAGWVLGEKAQAYMSVMEEQLGPLKVRASEAIQVGVAVVREKALEVDETHAISASVRAFDEQHQITTQAARAHSSAKDMWEKAVTVATPLALEAADRVGHATEVVKVRALQDPNIAQGLASARSRWRGVHSWATATWMEAEVKWRQASDPS